MLTRLALTRKQFESVVIGDGQIEVTVVDVFRDKVKLVFTAPREVSVHRKEIWLQDRRDSERG